MFEATDNAGLWEVWQVFGWKTWDFFLVDPLDGTKEFLKRTGEFTINIALIC